MTLGAVQSLRYRSDDRLMIDPRPAWHARTSALGAILLSVLLLVTVIPVPVSATAASSAVTSDTSGTQVLDSDQAQSADASPDPSPPVDADPSPTPAAAPGPTSAPPDLSVPVGPAFVFPFTWKSPTKAPPTRNRVTAGGRITIRFSLGGNRGLDIFGVRSPTSQRYDCATGASIPHSKYQTRPHGSDGLRYDAARQIYSYTWQTREEWSNTCRLFRMQLRDGSVHVARFFLATFNFITPYTLPLPSTNTAVAGTIARVRFHMGASAGTNIFKSGYPRSAQIDCATDARIGSWSRTNPHGTSGLTRNASTHDYRYSWQTLAAWTGTCRTFEMRLRDTSVEVLRFQFDRPPHAVNDSGTGYTTDEATAITTGNVLANDSDPDGDALTVVGLSTAGTAGHVTDNGDGTFGYDPNGAYEHLGVGESATDHFGYTVSDGHSGTDTATVTIAISGVNDDPHAVDDGRATNEDTPRSFDPRSNDSDPDTSDILSITSVGSTAMSGTTVVITGGGTGVTYDPNGQFAALAAGDSATDSFSYTIDDGHGGTDTATVTMTINGLNADPHAIGDDGPGFGTDEDTPFTTGDVLANDTDPEGQTLSVSALDTTGTAGQVTDKNDGTFGYDPNGAFETLGAGESDSDTFGYTLSDGHGGTDTATVTIAIGGVDDDPTNIGLSPASVAEGQPVGTTVGTLTTTDVDASDSHTYALVPGAGDDDNGLFTLAGTTLQTNAVLDYEAASTRTIRIRTDDGHGGTFQKAFTITIGNINEPPVQTLPASFHAAPETDTPLLGISIADPDAGSAAVQLTLTVDHGTLTVDTTVSGGITAGGISGNGTSAVTISASLATIDATLADAAGLIYRSDTGFGGASDTLSMTTDDQGNSGSGGAQTDTDTRTIYLNQAPVANDQGVSTSEDVAKTIILTATDADDNDLTFTITGGPSHGGLSAITATDCSAVNTCTASVTYTPDLDSTGPDSFTFKANDGSTDSTDGTVSVTVTAVNDAPVLDSSRTPVLTTETEDAGIPAGPVGTLVSGLVDGAVPAGQVDNVSDADADALLGIAVTATDATNGTWFYSVDDGTTWDTLGTPSGSSARLLAATAGRLYFQPDPDVNGVIDPAITFRAWDQTSGVDGGTVDVTINGGTTAFSSVTDTASLTVTAVNDAPVLDSSRTPVLTTETEDAGIPAGPVGTLVSGLVDGAVPAGQVDNVSDADADALLGIAVTATDATNGTWFYSVDDGTTWDTLGTPSGSSARLLAATAGRLYFQPDPDVNGVIDPAITFRAWDQTSGVDGGTADVTINGGTTAFLSVTDTASLTVTAVNDAPVLDSSRTPVLTTETEDAGIPAGPVGTLVSGLVDGAVPAGQVDNVSDADAGALLGIAVTATDATNGTWFYSVDDGTTWDTLGTPSGSSARLLAATAGRLYFQPDPDVNGVIDPAITFRAWDQTSGVDGGTVDVTINGGTTAFLSVTDTASLTVTAVNDAPVAQPRDYTAQANMKITGLSGLLIGVTDGDTGVSGCTPTFTVASVGPVTTPSGGTISNVDPVAGTFDFEPPPGASGPVTFGYTVSDDGCPGSATSAPATITVTVAGPVIWFVDDSAAPGGDGTLGSPFDTLAAAVAAIGASTDQRIFLYDGSYATGVMLNSQGWLIGQPSTGVDFDALMGIAPPLGTVPRPTIGSAGPVTVQGTVTLATDARVQGIATDTGTATGIADPIAAITGVSVSESSVTTTTGTPLLLSNVSGSIVLSDLDKDGVGTGISLTGVDAPVTIPVGATIQATDTAAVAIDGGSGTFSYAGTISNAAGRTVSVINRTGASTATFSGQVTSTGGTSTGILLDNNDGGGTDSRVIFSGGLDVTTAGAAPAITETNGGALEVTGIGNTITTAAGAGLTMTGSNAGAAGVTFDSVLSASGTVATISTSTGTKTLGRIGTSSGVLPALDIDNGGTINVGDPTTLSTLSTTSGVNLLNASTLNVSGLGVGISKTGGGAALTISGSTLNNTGSAANGVDITTSGGGTGVNVTGGTVNLTGGGLTVNTDGASDGPGLVATTAGTTLTIQGTTNTITSGSQTALNVSTAHIGGSGLTFQSISANGATKGIVLNSTGTGAGDGGLTVTGNGTTDASGGTIQSVSARGGEFITTKALSLKNIVIFTNANTTDGGTCTDLSTSACNAAIYLSGVSGVTLDNINITGTTAQEAINGLTVSDFSLTNSTLANCGNGPEEGCIKMRELTGTSTISGSSLSFPGADVVEIVNTSGSLTLNVSNSTFRDSQSSGSGNTGIQLRNQGTSTGIVNVTNSTFLRIRTVGLNVQAINTASADVDVSTSTFDPGTGTMIGIDLKCRQQRVVEVQHPGQPQDLLAQRTRGQHLRRHQRHDRWPCQQQPRRPGEEQCGWQPGGIGYPCEPEQGRERQDRGQEQRRQHRVGRCGHRPDGDRQDVGQPRWWLQHPRRDRDGQQHHDRRHVHVWRIHHLSQQLG